MSDTMAIPSVMKRATMKMQHDNDPKQDLIDRIGDIAELHLAHNLILVAMYIRPEKTASGLFLPDETRKEDEYQGKVGLVLKKGPIAFVDDAVNKFGGFDVTVGDWVGFRTSDGFQTSINGVLCRLLEDSHIKSKIPSPDYVF
jgi:co-chaperonin GroES (HSP10)